MSEQIAQPICSIRNLIHPRRVIAVNARALRAVKETSMLRIIVTAALLASTTATMSFAEPIHVTNVEVTAEFTDMDASALAYWPNIETDLGTAIAALVVDLPGTANHNVTVRIQELGLDGSPIPSDTGEFNHLRGRVIAIPEGETTPTADFQLELFATAVVPATASPDAVVISPVEGEFYAALINSFATSVVDRLAMIDTQNAPPAILEETESSNDDNAAAPADDTPVVDPTDAETPVVEAPSEEEPVAEIPVEEAPVEGAPVEEAPVDPVVTE